LSESYNAEQKGEKNENSYETIRLEEKPREKDRRLKTEKKEKEGEVALSVRGDCDGLVKKTT